MKKQDDAEFVTVAIEVDAETLNEIDRQATECRLSRNDLIVKMIQCGLVAWRQRDSNLREVLEEVTPAKVSGEFNWGEECGRERI